MKIIHRPTWEVRIFLTPVWFDWWICKGMVYLFILFGVGFRLDLYSARS